MDSSELKIILLDLQARIVEIRNGIFDVTSKEKRLEEITIELSKEEVWSDLDLSQKLSKEDVNKAYIKIQKKIHPDISPETSRLSSIVNEAKEIILKDLS